jgi:uncharacterized phage protein (TIGR02218 family)
LSRTLTAGMTGHLATRSHTRCTMLLLELRDGTSIGITDHDRDIPFDLGDGTATYQSGTGILASDVSLQTGLDADNYEVTGPLKDDGDFTLERVVGGRFNRARAKLFQVNWRDTSLGAIKLLAGNVSEARIEGGKFILEVRSDCDRYNQVIGRLIVNNCDADFGDARCGATPVSTTLTITSVTDAMGFAGSYTGGPYADDYFNGGTIEALTGDLAGTDPIEIHDWSQAGGVVLFMPLVEPPAVGDTFTVKQGCPKSRLGCMARNNILNFRGFPEVPGSDQIFRPTIPGQGND